jgi:hypothetical protein
MDGSLDPLDAYELLSENSITALMAHPGFRAACETSAAGGVAHFLSLSETHRWLMKDIGRAAICLTAAILQITGIGLTAQSLTAACLAHEISSAGRVHEVIRRLEKAGELAVEPGPGSWTRRRLTLAASFIAIIGRRMVVELRGLAEIWPAAAAFAASLDDDPTFRGYVIEAATLSTTRRDLFSLTDDPIAAFFLQREAGMLMLYDLLGQQDLDRDRLLEAAPLSRNALSRRYGVSRAHINKLLADATAAGYLRCEWPDLVRFDATVSRTVERMFALVFELARAASTRARRTAIAKVG